MSLPQFYARLIANGGVDSNTSAHLVLTVVAFAFIVLVVVFGSVDLIFSRRRKENLGDILLVMCLSVVGGVVAWWVLTTPFDRFPFAPPASGTDWGIFPAPLYGLTAVLIHAALSLVGSMTLTVFFAVIIDDLPWPLSDLAETSAFDVLVSAALIIGFVLPIAAWQFQRWPGWLVGLGELIAALVLPAIFVDAFRKPLRRRRKPEKPGDLYRIDYLLSAVDYALRFLGVAAVILFHDTEVFTLTFVLVFFALTFVDDIAYYVIAYIRPMRYPLSPFRWVGTIPCVLGLAVLGISGWVGQISTNPRLTDALWLECSAAACVFLLFKVLRDHAKDITFQRELEMEEFQGNRLIAEFRNVLNRGGSEDDRVSKADDAVDGTAESRPAPFGLDPSPDLPLSSAAPVKSPAEITFQRTVAESLRFPARTIFLLAGLGYHYLIIGTGATTILQSSLALLAFGLLPLLATRLPIVNLTLLETPRYVATLLIYVILILAGVNTLFVISHVSDQLPMAVGASMVSLANLDGDAIVGHVFAEEALVLATVGQIFYLFGYMAAALRADQNLASKKDNQGWIELAEWRESQNDDDGALEAYQSAAQADEQDALPWLRIAIIHRNHARYDDALHAIYISLHLAPEASNVWYWYGMILRARKQYRWALSALGRALQYSPRSSGHWEAAADLLVLLREYEQAEIAYQRALQYRPSDANLWTDYAALLTERLDKHAEALDAIDHAIALARNFRFAWYIKGRILRALGREQEALKAFELVLTLTPRVSPTAGQLNTLAYTYVELGQFAEALASIDQAIALEPNDGDYHDSKGEILMEMGPDHYAEALAEFERALELSPDLLSSLEFKAYLLRALGRADEAFAIEIRVQELRS